MEVTPTATMIRSIHVRRYFRRPRVTVDREAAAPLGPDGPPSEGAMFVMTSGNASATRGPVGGTSRAVSTIGPIHHSASATTLPAVSSDASREEIVCPACGDDEHLRGEQRDGLIHIRCGSCDVEWDRDPARRCPSCDSVDLYPVPVAIIEKSRGTQLSILGTRPEYLCWVCDRDLIDAQRRSGTALMPDQMPTSAPDRPSTPAPRERGPSVGRSIDVSSGWDALSSDDLADE